MVIQFVQATAMRGTGARASRRQIMTLVGKEETVT